MGNAGSRQQLPDFPPELLAEIFNFACDDYKQHVHNVMNDIHPFWFNIERKEYIVTPGTLSRVCRAWKDFAYRTPVLWDTVFVDMDSDPRYATYKDLDSSISEAAMKLKKWLDRAGNFPLTVKIDGPDLVKSKSNFESPVVAESSPAFTFGEPHSPVFKGTQLSLSLAISGIAVTSTRSNSPNIQSLDLYILVGQIPADMLLDILRIAPNLKHFKIGFGGYYIGTRPNISMSQSSTVPGLVVLDSLISYHIDMSDLSQDSDINAAFLKYLSLPALNDFQVLFPPQQTTKINRKSQVTYLAALDLVKRSSCPLRSLKIDTEANIPETALFNLLSILPSLEYLCLVGQNYNVGRLLNKKSTADVKFHIASSFFKLLIPRPRSSASTIYLPKLRDLSLEGILTANGDEVLSALEYRWKGDEDLGIQKLSRVRLYSPDFIGKPTDKRFRRRYEDLQLQGMDVEFGKPS
ncbi:hypothetical protein BDQ17DRAFT_1332702 [Cyathus striatus]|nr:hypothetical protein BDQ17DRAFT_1332702 [Cyathus striatus]